jgi:ABC-type transport system substrate-binding protein
MLARAAALLVVAAACGGDRAAPEPRFAGAGAPGPRRGGTLRLAFVDDVRGLDPARSFDEFSFTAERLLYDTLVDYAPASAPDPLAIVPSLAESFTRSPDGRVYRFTLRPGVTYSNGEPLVAADFVHALERVLAPETASPGAGFYLGVAGAQEFVDGRAPAVAGLRAPDERHLEIELATADLSFLQRLALPFATPQKRGAAVPLGTGPFVLESWKPGQRMAFARNPRYWRPELPHLDRVEIDLLVPSDVAGLRFFAGELETLDRPRADDFLRLSATPAWAPLIHRVPAMQVIGEAMNVTRPPFDDRRVRLAFNHAIDRRAAVALANGRAVPARAILPPLVPGHDATLPVYRHDPARARALLAEAGYPAGLEVTYTTILDPLLQLVAQSIQADLAEIGVRVRIEYLTFPAYLAAVGRGDLAFSFAGWSMDFPDPYDFLETMFHSRAVTPEHSVNYARYGSPAVDQLLDAARIEPGERRRFALYRSAEHLIHADAPWVFHYHPVVVEVLQPYVMGYRPHPVWQRDVRNAWLDLPRRRAR